MTRFRSATWIVIPLFLLFSLLLCAVVWLLSGTPSGRITEAVIDTEVGADSTPVPITCVVIDAGHGGEDGGASSAAGLTEKDVNLAVAMALRDLFEAAGVPTVMTRTEDKLLYDRGVDYHGRKKVLDLAARRAIADATEGCLLISIHMNAFPQEQYSGMQVWYGEGDERSQAIAADIQAGACILMPENNRKIKAAGRNIYLLDRAVCPAVLVECGFLSNPAEAQKLEKDSYRYALATVIAGAVLPHLTIN